MTDLTYKLVVNKKGYYTFTMPDGFEDLVQVYLWGAGGSDGTGAPGAGGGYASSNIAIVAGNTVGIVVGGANGAGSSIGFRGGRGAPQGDPEDGDAGAGGSGGGATAVVINAVPAVVAGGGGGGGGYGDDRAGGATAGYPGGEYPGRTSSVYAVTLSYAWCSFMNSYAVWGGGQDYSTVVNFPTTGTYTFKYSVDNYGQVYLDGSSIISYSTFSDFTTYTQVVSAGNGSGAGLV
jgi:hypothetical protein